LSKKNNTLIIWDLQDCPKINYDKIILWRSFGYKNHPNAISIPNLVEKNDVNLKSRYLSWIYELGENRIKGKRLIDHLELRPGFSFWWMTLIFEKSNWAKSPQIYEVIRLLAFEEWFKTQEKFSRIYLYSSSVSLHRSIRIWCDKKGIDFHSKKRTASLTFHSIIKRIRNLIPHPIRAFIWIITYVFQRWSLKNVGTQEWSNSKGQITFVSYLFNLNYDLVENGNLNNPYWGNLPDELQRNGFKSNWLHLYIKDVNTPNASKASKILRKVNMNNQEQIHTTIDSFLNVNSILKAISDWFKLFFIAWFLRKERFAEKETSFDLFNLLRRDWNKSIFGKTALSNLLHFNLIELAMKSLPKQQKGLYLQENQGWEFALIHAWNTAGHEELIGTAHSTIRFWDLRYFVDSRTFKRFGINDMPLPTRIALNSDIAFDSMLKGGYPKENMVMVEALRYINLKKNKPPLAFERLSTSSEDLYLLVMGDYLMQNTKRQMSFLEDAIQSINFNIRIMLKPHPNYPVVATDYPALKLMITTDPISKLLPKCNAAYTSNVTSAAVEAYCAGKFVISVIDPTILNMSPLREKDDVLFVSSIEDLIKALNQIQYNNMKSLKTHSYFCLDSNLPRWKKVLELNNKNKFEINYN